MAYDLKRTFSGITLTRPLSAGTIVDREGMILVKRLEDNVEKLHLAAVVAATDIPVGFTKLGDSLPGRTSAVEAVTVPSAPATLEADLRNHNLVVGMVRAVDSAGVALAIDAVFAGAPAANTVKIDHPTGRCKFNATQAGLDVAFTYLYDLTFVEATQKFGQRFVNNSGLHAQFGVCEVGSGHVELYTDQFDASADWTTGAPILLGDNGQLVLAGVGPTLTATVIGIPSVDTPFLGVRIHFA